MAAPAFLLGIFGWRKGVPNCADVDSNQSKAIAGHIFSALGVTRSVPKSFAAGTALEEGVRAFLESELERRAPGRTWQVERKKVITDYSQYAHLARLDAVVKANPTLRTEIGQDYLIKPDVTVGLPTGGASAPVLHAAISCKWTIRSDRVQNIRHEGIILTRNRRGRQPHIVTVTAEPLPSRIAAIARGTGEVDAVYHVALEELRNATKSVGNAEQRADLDELTGQSRLAGFRELVDVLVHG